MSHELCRIVRAILSRICSSRLSRRKKMLCVFYSSLKQTEFFTSWSKINDYYAVHQMTSCSQAKDKRHAQIGLRVCFVCSNNPKAKAIRKEIRGVAADRWKHKADEVVRSSACCFWLRHIPNCSSYQRRWRNLAILRPVKVSQQSTFL